MCKEDGDPLRDRYWQEKSNSVGYMPTEETAKDFVSFLQTYDSQWKVENLVVEAVL